LWRTPKAQDSDRGSCSNEGIRKRLTKGQTIRLQDQVNHPLLFRTPDAGCYRGAQSPERFVESQEQGMLLTLNDQVAHMWATPKATDATTGTTARTSGRPLEKTTHLAAQVHLYPTPRATDGEKGTRSPQGAEKEIARGHGADLPTFIQIFPTPTAHGNYNRKGSSANSGDGLATAVRMLPSKKPTMNAAGGNGAPPLGAAASGSLNPAWVEWLMGFPDGWTDPGMEVLDHSACINREWWRVEPDIPRVAKGIPRRVQRLKTLGNAVVPAQIFPLFAALMKVEAES
jgi:hypothetical protein